ncbi:hypothetical protein F511_29816 [Dorcoceras hygrometricum]|uniref:ALOG domain-containing protein n=1 Tax=Dorcoceras hygrometricum TaxID=472368 RepID=A0A2Z7C5Z9_9LAMI|nr:hypothetical protein F511_29816 [Dorcoceras hygrometricum]
MMPNALVLGDHVSSSSSSSSALASASASAADRHDQPPQPPQLSRYESQKRRDWNTFGQYLRNLRPPLALSQCNYSHVLDFLRYLDQFGKTKVHTQGCMFFGQPDPAGPVLVPSSRPGAASMLSLAGYAPPSRRTAARRRRTLLLMGLYVFI